MPREVLNLLPHELLGLTLATAGLCAVLGVILWLCGARFSRSILALIGVAAGTFIGMRLPAWRGWNVDGMGLAVGGAILLGTGAFLFHRTCIGVLLGGGLMLWTASAVWIFAAGDATWDWRTLPWQGDMVQYLREAWHALPPDLSEIFPIACFAGLASGIVLAVFLPKFSKVLAHSLIGVTLMFVMGTLLIAATHGHWLSKTPGPLAMQGLALVGMVLLGAIVQWRITPPHSNARSNGVKKS